MNRPANIPDEFWTLLDAACDGELAAADSDTAAADRARLEAYLRSHPDAHRAFVNHIRLRSHLRLWWKGERSRQAGLGRVAAANDECGRMDDESPREPPTPAASPIHHSSFLLHPSLHPSFFGGVMASYLVATLILGLAAVNAWLWQSSAGVARPERAWPADSAAAHLAAPFHGVPAPQPAPAGALVGRITVASECRLAATAAERGDPTPVCLGRKFVLRSGLLEISYTSGWQVILQGPATFQVDAEDGGFLASGKLTARFDPAGSGFRVQGPGANSPRRTASDQSAASAPMSFALRTPAATITSAAGEMGVEVPRTQACRVCIFDGQAELRSNGEKSGPAPFVQSTLRAVPANGACPLFSPGTIVARLHENQSVEAVQAGAQLAVGPLRLPQFAAGFARRIARPVFPAMSAPERQLAGIWLKSIGPEITEGRLIAIGSGQDIELPAAATAGEKHRGVPPHKAGRPNESGGFTLTSRQLFEVNDVALDTAIVQGWFVTQGRVTAVRFNGQSLSGLIRGNGGGNGGFVVGKGLVQPVNTLEMDLGPVPPPGPQNNCVMWLRLRVSGIRLPGQQAPPTPGVVPSGAKQQRSAVAS